MVGKLRFVGICASPRKKGNTQILLGASLEAAERTASILNFSAEVELVQLAGRKISPCLGCDQCARQRRHCIIEDDWHNLVRPLIDPVPDGVIFGSPVYFFNQNALGRAYMERCTSLVKGIWDPDTTVPLPDWSTTVAGAVAVGYDRHGGGEVTLTSILQWFLVMGFPVVGGFYIGGAAWTGLRSTQDAVKQDKQELEAARLVGRRIARTAALLKSGKQALGPKAEIDVSWRSMELPIFEQGGSTVSNVKAHSKQMGWLL